MLKTASPRAGRLVEQRVGPKPFLAFVPKPLPPDPPLVYDDELGNLIENANRSLGRLDGATYLLPNPDLFLYMFIRKEAVLSSQIEGTQASLAELLEYESLGEQNGHPDVKEVSNYVAAMDYGLQRLKELPLSLRLIREIHTRLLEGTRGGHKAPGEFRKSQNWIGGTMPSDARFVPPPAHEVMPCMGELEKFINAEYRPSALIKAGLAHAQFETIHPFLDGNGRLGRLLITFTLCAEKVVERPLLYLSLYFKQHRDEYYERLTAVRRDGDWEGWIKFYLTGIYEVSTQATNAAKSILDLQRAHSLLVNSLGRSAPIATRLLDMLFRQPLVSVPSTAKALDVSAPAARNAINCLQELGILREVSGKRRNRFYMYDKYLSIIKHGSNI